LSFLACRVFQEGDRVAGRMVSLGLDDLGPGEVVIRAAFSGINYKDALAVTGRGRILKRLPLVAGIDVAGTVDVSSDPRFREGQPVLVTGMGLGETQDGGFAQRVRVPAEWVVPMPEGLELREAMVLGTAGFSAALAVNRLETMGQRPDHGPIVVTGAAGGVGSIAVAILAARGYEVIGVSSRPEHHPYLLGLGAAQAVTPEGLALGAKPLERARFGGVVDNVGGALLSSLLPHVKPWGSVASVGNAGGPDVKTTVFPFILRGVNLLGVSSMDCAMPLRRALWDQLAGPMRPRDLDAIVSKTVPLASILGEFEPLLERRVRGRILVECGG
jgi:NADPH2:quinone reductase